MNRDTAPICIGPIKDEVGFTAENRQKNKFLLNDNRDFVINSVGPLFSLSVPIREIRGSPSWENSRRKDES
jgi:hypothetical protein